MLGLQTNFYNIIGNEINSTFEKPNHIVPHHVVKNFFVKFVCKPRIFLLIRGTLQIFCSLRRH
jgi:hypothetical protein